MKNKISYMKERVCEDLRNCAPHADAGLKAEIEGKIETIRRGRKPFPAERLRKHRIMTCFNDAEIDAVINAAGDREIAEFLREIILKGVRFNG